MRRGATRRARAGRPSSGRPSSCRPSTARAVAYTSGPLLALALVMFLQQGEATSLSLAVPGITRAFRVSDASIGVLPFALAAVGLLGSVPFGVLADRRRRTMLLALSVAVWTATMAASGLASSFLALFLARLGVGLVEANGPAAVSLLGDYYPVGERGRRMGYYQLGSFVGALFAYLVGGVLVQQFGFRLAFFMWIPLGLLVTLILVRQPEPRRGDQEMDYGAEVAARAYAVPGLLTGYEAAHDVTAEAHLYRVASAVRLPEPRRQGTLDYRSAPLRQVAHEILQIRSMWFSLVALTISQLLLSGLAFWGITYFERVHHLAIGLAGLVAGVLSIGAAGGILTGGWLSDRLMARGIINSRIYVSAAGCLLGTALLVPAFASTRLPVTVPLFLLGGFMLTVPVAPCEAIVADVVVCDLRGRATTARTIVRTLSQAGPLVIGMISSEVGLRLALVAVTPLYALGGLVLLLATRHYPWDLSYVLAETRRTAALRAATAG